MLGSYLKDTAEKPKKDHQESIAMDHAKQKIARQDAYLAKPATRVWWADLNSLAPNFNSHV
jgi:hypothetical protein